MKPENLSWFSKMAKNASRDAGRPGVFLAAVLGIVIWAIWGPFVHFSETWQLVINTSTTIITFLMVFLIQNSQNRDSSALQMKLDELIRVQREANNALIGLEDQGDEKLEEIKSQMAELVEDPPAKNSGEVKP